MTDRGDETPGIGGVRGPAHTPKAQTSFHHLMRTMGVTVPKSIKSTTRTLRLVDRRVRRK